MWLTFVSHDFAIHCVAEYIYTYFDEDVAIPSDYDLPYELLELKTEDDILLRCFLLIQKKDLGPLDIFGSYHLPIPDGTSEEEVNCEYLYLFTCVSLFYCSYAS